MIRTKFADCLNSALLQSGKSLSQVQLELQARGFRINKSTLNRWANGLSTPRRDKLALLRYLPDLLDMRPALRAVFNSIVNQMAGVPITGGKLVGGLNSRQNYFGGPVVYFTGRFPELSRLKEAVNKRQTVLITGLGGMGKTHLARKLLEETCNNFSYGCDAMTINPDQSPMSIVEQVAHRLGVPMSSITVGQDLDTAVRELREWTDNVDMLFLVDDIQESGQVRQLVSELKNITWVITSRRKLFLPFDFVEVALTPPPVEDAVSMLCHYSSLPQKDWNLSTASEIVKRLGSLPIAIRAAGGLVQTGYLPDLSALLGWLSDQGLDGLRLDDWGLTDFLAGLLEMVEPNGRDLFALCGIFPSGQIDLSVFKILAKALGLPPALLGHLANLSLIEWQTPQDQFHLHPLIYEYAVQYLDNHSRKDEISAIFAAYYADFARRNHVKHQYLEPELPELIKAARIACKKADWQLLQPLWRVVSSSLWRLSDWSTYRRFDEKCLKVARKTGDRHIESRILSELGWVSLEEGKWEEADAYFKQAQNIVDDLTSTRQSVRLRRYRAILFTKRGQLDKAAVLLSEAEHLLEKTAEVVQWSKRSRDRSLALLYHAHAGLALAANDYDTALRKEMNAIGLCRHEDSNCYRPMFDLQLGDVYYLQKNIEKAGCIWQRIIRHGAKHQPEQRIIAAAFLRMAQLAAYLGNRERTLGWAYRAQQLYHDSGLAEKARQAGKLAQELATLTDERPEVWPEFELWD